MKWKNQSDFEKWLVGEYLHYGSVNAVLYKYRFSPFPVSPAEFHRIIKRCGIIKNVGRRSTHLGEAILFLEHIAETNLPLESAYKKLPPSFKTSLSTLHRIYRNIKHGISRRTATGLFLTPENDDGRILVGSDIASPRVMFGKEIGSKTIPMTFSSKREPQRNSILRVLQQEVFSDLAVENKIPPALYQNVNSPFVTVFVADIKINIFHISVPNKIIGLMNSYKLTNINFIDLNKLNRSITERNSAFSVGIAETILAFQKKMVMGSKHTSIVISKLNKLIIKGK